MLYLIDSDRDAGLLQVLNHLRPGVLHGHPHVLAGDFGHLTIQVDRDDFLQPEFPEQHDVVIITIAADHDSPAPKLHIHAPMRPYRHLPVVDRDDSRLPDILLVTWVTRMHYNHLAGGEQFRACRGNQQVLLHSSDLESVRHQVGRKLLVFYLGIGYRGVAIDAVVVRTVRHIDEPLLPEFYE